MLRRKPKVKISFEDFDKENRLFRRALLREWEQIAAFKQEGEGRQYIASFEDQFASANHSGFCLAVNSGTTALGMALSACSIGRGDEVILPAYTYISSALAVSQLGAVPRFVDIKTDTLTLDPKEILKHLSKKTKAVMAVHIHGNPAEMDTIMAIAKDHRLHVIEDCSHAHGASYQKTKVGNFGIGCFSCQATKNLGSIGNAGVVTCRDRWLFETMKDRMDVRQDPDPSLSPRVPCSMDPLQAAVLSVKLPFLDRLNTIRRQLARMYRDGLAGVVGFQETESGGCHVYRDVIIRHKRRDDLQTFLAKCGIETKIRYPVPLHRTAYYRGLGRQPRNLPVAQEVCANTLHLPCRPGLEPDSAKIICQLIKEFF